MALPDLPTTKANVIARAEKERWYFEERKGLGGTRRVYEIPARYLGQADASAPAPDKPVVPKARGEVVGTITPGGPKVDLEKLQFVDRVLEEWLQERGLRLKPERRAAVLSVLYDYMTNKGATSEEVQRLLKITAS
ncbi:hypothetical protein PNO31109_01263 [Pandoraea nosoerga]|uniref:HTH Mu-type domain-containing protein n=2 Tax=Pandoraea nosoerga TaxID=2508296 RepID=A0A5E4T9Q4_9BURK|nr:hypothetical protein PNO31109_01263 [Pandoraea nosoerga]